MTLVNHGVGGDRLSYLYDKEGVWHCEHDVRALVGSEPSLFGLHEIQGDALYQMLRVGFVPLPKSIFRRLRILGSGDVARIAGPHIEMEYESPFLRAKSSQLSFPSEALLLDRLVSVINKEWDGANSGYLMQSGGKDSTALALAVARSDYGNQCTGVTFSNGLDSDEHDVARDVCNRLGMKHETILVDVGANAYREEITKVFRNMAMPSVDQAVFAYSICAGSVVGSGDLILDGTGCDAPFGFPGQPWLRRMDKFFPNGLPFGKLLMGRVSRRQPWAKLLVENRAEMFFSNYYLSESELGDIFPSAHAQQRKFWKHESSKFEGLDTIEFASMVKLRHADTEMVMRKGRSVAQALDARICFPWSSVEMVDFVFNLPESARFNARTGEGKLLLKSMLKKYLDYDAEKIGKNVFRFDCARFLISHRDWVTSEICACRLWEVPTSVPALIDKLYRELGRGLRAHNALMGMFSISLWANHSRFLVANAEA